MTRLTTGGVAAGPVYDQGRPRAARTAAQDKGDITVSGSATQRPGGRTARNTAAVYQGVLELLRSRGPEFTYQELAEVSGVSRRTLHRRWEERRSLITEALRDDYGKFEMERTGDLATDLREFARRFRDFTARPTAILIDGLAAISPDEDMAQLSRRAFEESTRFVAELFADAEAAGQGSVDASTLQSVLISPIVVHASILRSPLDDGELDQLVDQILRLLAPERRP